jgi:hypothetical protein
VGRQNTLYFMTSTNARLEELGAVPQMLQGLKETVQFSQ